MRISQDLDLVEQLGSEVPRIPAAQSGQSNISLNLKVTPAQISPDFAPIPIGKIKREKMIY